MKSKDDPKCGKRTVQAEISLFDDPKKPSSTAVNRCNFPQNKPLVGKSFYLDLLSAKKAENLERDLKKLGGTIEKFFSKDIKYLVSDKQEARYIQRLGREYTVPSPDSGLSSPHPSSRAGSPRGSSQGLGESVVVSRGKSLVEKVVKDQGRFQINRILSNASEWGVKILYIDDVLSYLEKRKIHFRAPNAPAAGVEKVSTTRELQIERSAFQKYEAGRIRRPFVKVEDYSRHYKPVYLSMPDMPQLSFTSTVPCSPFTSADSGKEQRGKKMKEYRNKFKCPEAKARRRSGYCECCGMKYENINQHLHSEQHKTFSVSNKYHVVDKLISKLLCDFVEIKRQAKRVKCSVSSVVRASVPETQNVLNVTGIVSSPGFSAGTYLRASLPGASASTSGIWSQRKRSRTSLSDSRQSGVEQTRKSRCGSSPLPTHPACYRSPGTASAPELSLTNKPCAHGGMSIKCDEDLPRASKAAYSQCTETHDCPQELKNTQSRTACADSPTVGLQRKAQGVKRPKKASSLPPFPCQEAECSSSEVLWKLFQSSDDSDQEFVGFTDRK